MVDAQEIPAIILFVILSLIFALTIIALVRDGLRAKTNRWILVFISAMYITSTVIFSPEIHFLSQRMAVLAQISRDPPYLRHELQSQGEEDDLSLFMLLDNLGILIGAIFGDAIILWRVIAVWPGNKSVKRITIALYALILTTSIASIYFLLQVRLLMTPVYPVFLGLSLVSNLWATTMIGIRAWLYRNMLRRQVAILSGRSVLERMLSLLAESGAIYCVAWAIYFSLSLHDYLTIGPDNSGDSYGFSKFRIWLSVLLWFFVPIYPMLIVLLVARHKSVLQDDALTSIEAVTKHDLADDSSEYTELYAPSSEQRWTMEPFLGYTTGELSASHVKHAV